MLLHICDLDVKICFRSSVSDMGGFQSKDSCASLFVRANQPLSSWKQGTERTKHKLGDRTGFIPTDSLLTLEKLLNFSEP